MTIVRWIFRLLVVTLCIFALAIRTTLCNDDELEEGDPVEPFVLGNREHDVDDDSLQTIRPVISSPLEGGIDVNDESNLDQRKHFISSGVGQHVQKNGDFDTDSDLTLQGKDTETLQFKQKVFQHDAQDNAFKLGNFYDQNDDVHTEEKQNDENQFYRDPYLPSHSIHITKDDPIEELQNKAKLDDADFDDGISLMDESSLHDVDVKETEQLKKLLEQSRPNEANRPKYGNDDLEDFNKNTNTNTPLELDDAEGLDDNDENIEFSDDVLDNLREEIAKGDQIKSHDENTFDDDDAFDLDLSPSDLDDIKNDLMLTSPTTKTNINIEDVSDDNDDDLDLGDIDIDDVLLNLKTTTVAQIPVNDDTTPSTDTTRKQDNSQDAYEKEKQLSFPVEGGLENGIKVKDSSSVDIEDNALSQEEGQNAHNVSITEDEKLEDISSEETSSSKEINYHDEYHNLNATSSVIDVISENHVMGGEDTELVKNGRISTVEVGNVISEGGSGNVGSKEMKNEKENQNRLPVPSQENNVTLVQKAKLQNEQTIEANYQSGENLKGGDNGQYTDNKKTEKHLNDDKGNKTRIEFSDSVSSSKESKLPSLDISKNSHTKVPYNDNSHISQDSGDDHANVAEVNSNYNSAIATEKSPTEDELFLSTIGYYQESVLSPDERVGVASDEKEVILSIKKRASGESSAMSDRVDVSDNGMEANIQIVTEQNVNMPPVADNSSLSNDTINNETSTTKLIAATSTSSGISNVHVSTTTSPPPQPITTADLMTSQEQTTTTSHSQPTTAADPCTPDPCKNSALCEVIPGSTDFKCLCTSSLFTGTCSLLYVTFMVYFISRVSVLIDSTTGLHNVELTVPRTFFVLLSVDL